MERSRTGRFRTRWYVIALSAALLLCLTVLARDILPARRQLRKLREREGRLLRENRELEEEIRRLQLLGDALESDPQTIERALREKIRLGRPGEKLIRFEEDETRD